MIYLGIVIMTYSIYQYMRFAQEMTQLATLKKERRIFNIPISLLILFLIGYIIIAFLGKPDITVSLILFGGSIFVYVMQILMKQAVNQIREHEHLEARAKAAEDASKAKSYFLSNMSHDIRTPLNAIIGYTTLAQTSSLEEQIDYIAKIDKASHQMLELVNEVLEMSRIESGRYELDPVDTNLKELCSRVCDVMRVQMENKNIDFKTSCDMKQAWVVCDGHRLERILMNMVSNAYKFTNDYGTVSFSLKQTGFHENKGDYEFTIQDTGIGMSPEFLKQVFVPFERERTSTVSGIQGTGLGMPIAKSIVDLMGGTIDVSSQQGKGTTFVVKLSFPYCHAKEEEETSGESIDFTGKHLLLVEDNMINQEIAKMLLTQAGFTVEVAENGKIGLDKIQASKPGDYDLILMDIQMPVMDGYEATKAIRSLPDEKLAKIPIIAMTANAFKEDVDHSRNIGMQAHVAKPIDIDHLLITIHDVLLEARNQ